MLYSFKKTIALKHFVYERFKDSKIPLNEIITDEVHFTADVTVPGIYLYARFKSFYLRSITLYRSEWETLKFSSAEDLCFEFAKRQATQKAMREINGNFSEYALSILKDIDENFYNCEIGGIILWRDRNEK